MFEYFACEMGTHILQYRLNYAVEPRYGIPVDLALKILSNEPIDLSMGFVNLIWQRDANEIALRSLNRDRILQKFLTLPVLKFFLFAPLLKN